MRKQQLKPGSQFRPTNLISCPEDYTAPPTTINPILRPTVAILGLRRRGFLAGCRVPGCGAFRTISLVSMEMKRLPI
jgi:hypothetical protein